MKNSDIIKIVREPVLDFYNKYSDKFIEKNIYPSQILSLILINYSNGETTDEDIYNNNIFGLIDSTGEHSKFNTIEECLLLVIGNFLLDNYLSNNEDQIKSTSKSNNLSRFDKEILNKISDNIVNLDEEQCIPQVDQYTVKEENSILLKTDNLESAKEAKEKSSKAEIYNSQGKLITTQQTNYTQQVKSILIAAGSLFECSNVHLYYKETDTRPGRVISGVYKLYDGVKRRNRYAICMKNSNIILGYINADVLK